MVDITNQFIFEGVTGGVLKFILFIAIIVICFRKIGGNLKRNPQSPFPVRLTVWAMGAALCAHVAAFLSVSYFDQMIVLWYLLIAMIAAVSNLPQRSTARREFEDAREWISETARSDEKNMDDLRPEPIGRVVDR
jgi:small-conductance mechanosensitive channel